MDIFKSKGIYNQFLSLKSRLKSNSIYFILSENLLIRMLRTWKLPPADQFNIKMESNGIRF